MGGRLSVLCAFDPWSSPYCTCPPKYSFSPYTGCGHKCIYCYVNYIPRFEIPRKKKEVFRRIESDLKLIQAGSLISISNSSDPYQPQEEFEHTFRKILEILASHPLRILIITKSDMVTRDIDILKKMRCAVMITITTLRDRLAKKLEPFAPSPKRRLDAIEELAKNRIPCGVRIDPVIPHINEDEISDIIQEAKKRGALHIVSSTYKAKRLNFLRLKEAFPEIRNELEDLYLKKGVRFRGSIYMEENKRKQMMDNVKKECENHGLSFSTCREGFYELRSPKSCDGSHLIA